MLGLNGCDQGEPDVDPPRGPALQLTGVFPSPEQGVECSATSPDDCGVPRDSPILLRFNRYLRPSTAVRQSIRVTTGEADVSSGFFQPEYDVIERVLVFRRQEGALLEPGALYTIELVVPSDMSVFGLEAFDGAPLAEGVLPLKFDFRAARAEPPMREPPPAREPTPKLGSLLASCTSVACHNSVASAEQDVPRMGLDLASPQGLRETAIARVAHQTDLSGKAGVVLESPPRFGVGVPVIDPNRPSNSYLLYKLLRKPENFGGDSCNTRYVDLPLANGECLYRDDESKRLREWFVRGDPMPRGSAVDMKSLREIQAWIRGGASP